MGKIQVALFSQILVVITNSVMDDISHDHPGLCRCKFCYVTAVRACDVIRGHQNVFANNGAYKKLQHRALSQCVQLIKMHRMIYIHVDLEVTSRSRDLTSTVGLELMRSSYTYLDVYQ